MTDWLLALGAALQSGEVLVRVAVASVKGSAPREPGACMLVGAKTQAGTIGGGHLEFKALKIARDMLSRRDAGRGRIERFALGAALGQCCGGAVNLWFDRWTQDDLGFVRTTLAAREDGPTVIATRLDRSDVPSHTLYANPLPAASQPTARDTTLTDALAQLLDAPPSGAEAVLLSATADRPATLLARADPDQARLWLFGAGHVGRALVGVLSDLPFEVQWVDNRANAFPAKVPANAVPRPLADPVQAALVAPAGDRFLVMTHSHDLDYEICAALLRRDDHAWAGLIGSETKSACFNLRFARDGIAPQAVARLVCPIGLGTLRSKLPGAIAISVAAQLLETLEATPARPAATIPAPGRALTT